MSSEIPSTQRKQTTSAVYENHLFLFDFFECQWIWKTYIVYPCSLTSSRPYNEISVCGAWGNVIWSLKFIPLGMCSVHFTSVSRMSNVQEVWFYKWSHNEDTVSPSFKALVRPFIPCCTIQQPLPFGLLVTEQQNIALLQNEGKTHRNVWGIQVPYSSNTQAEYWACRQRLLVFVSSGYADYNPPIVQSRLQQLVYKWINVSPAQIHRVWIVKSGYG